MPLLTVGDLVTRMRALLRNPATMTQSNYATTDLVFYLQMAVRDAEIELSLLDANWNVTTGTVTLVSGTDDYPWPDSDDLFRACLMMEYNFNGRRYPINLLNGGWKAASAYSSPNTPNSNAYDGFLPLQVGAVAKFRLFPVPQENSTAAIRVTYEKSVIPNNGFAAAGSDSLNIPTEWQEFALWRGAAYACQQDEENPGVFAVTANARLKLLKSAYHYRAKGASQPREVILDD